MKIYLVSGNFLGRNDTRKYEIIKKRGHILFSAFFILNGWPTIKIFNYFKIGKWKKK